MKYSRFEDLPVWQAAVEFALKAFEFTNQADFRGLGDTKNQLERAALSISNNIAEGFERGATTELIYFLYIAKGSSGECRSMLRLCEQLTKFENFKSEISDLIGRATNISKQLNGWLEALKNTDIKGTRYLTEKVLAKRQQNEAFAEFDEEMARFRKDFELKLKAREEAAFRRAEVDEASEI